MGGHVLRKQNLGENFSLKNKKGEQNLKNNRIGGNIMLTL